MRGSDILQRKYVKSENTTFITEIHCLEKNCGHPDSIGLGSVSVKGDVAVFECDEGYEPSPGDQTLVCDEGGWLGTPPVCSGN